MHLHSAYLRQKNAYRVQTAVKMYWKEAVRPQASFTDSNTKKRLKVAIALLTAVTAALLSPSEPPGSLSVLVNGCVSVLVDIKDLARKMVLKAAKDIARYLE